MPFPTEKMFQSVKILILKLTPGNSLKELSRRAVTIKTPLPGLGTITSRKYFT